MWFVEKMLYQTHTSAGVTPSVWGKLYKTTLWQHRNFAPGVIYEDLEAMSHVALEAKKIALCKKQLYFYRHTPGSITHTFTPQRMDAVKVALKTLKDFSKTPALAAAARDRLFSAAYNIFLLISINDKNNSMEAEKKLCKKIIRKYRFFALISPYTRMRNRIGALMSYIPGLTWLQHPNVAKKLVKS